jgi:hypothetical protein
MEAPMLSLASLIPVLVAATVSGTPTPTPTPGVPAVTSATPTPIRPAPEFGRVGAPVTVKPMTLAEAAAAAKARGERGTLSVQGEAAPVKSPREGTRMLDPSAAMSAEEKAAQAALERNRVAVDQVTWTQKNVLYNRGIRQEACDEWEAAAENCRKTPGCSPIYPPTSKYSRDQIHVEEHSEAIVRVGRGWCP